MKKIKTYGKITNGKLIINRNDLLKKDIASMSDCDVLVIIEKIYSKRSDDQNKYLWGYVYPTVQDGLYDMHGERYTNKEVHDFFKIKFLSKEIVNTNTGEVERIGGSSAELTTVEFMEFIDEIIKWSADWLGISIMPPNTQSELNI